MSTRTRDGSRKPPAGRPSRERAANQAGATTAAGRKPRSERDFAGIRASRSDADASRPRILSAAAALFAECGFAAASIDQVGSRLGTTKGFVYHHYRSKGELYLDVCGEALRELEAVVLPALRAPERAITRLRRMAVSHAGDVFARLSFHKVLAEAVSGRMDGVVSDVELGAGEEPLAAMVLQREAYDARFATVIAEAAGERDLPAGRDTTMLGRAFVSVLDGPVRWPHKTRSEIAGRHALIARQLAYFAMRGAGASDYTLSEEFAQ
ncbi:TetR/AcrR family transcriptional regulator [Aurantimonas sp. VKM B-3413]|uniref:TetR/AcrR family transcriptional regulator n=1 Tax=Aurantimonas sp. VKM B-3413 TaxID=2779401 RepID=UPI001E51169B|nr:TetR/AcrR family transcriptional regulator [Aurantimonas sp. VKM B-3413]MCB8837629.1 TetR/AcrR family transcriptional regulator [Aurantimonas sp. VKM B-3413]